MLMRDRGQEEEGEDVDEDREQEEEGEELMRTGSRKRRGRM